MLGEMTTIKMSTMTMEMTMLDEMTTITRLLMTMLTMMMVMSMLLISLLLSSGPLRRTERHAGHSCRASAAKCTEAECNTGCYQLQFDLQIRSEARGEAGSLGVGVCEIRHVFRTSALVVAAIKL